MWSTEASASADLDIAAMIDQADEKLFQLVLTNPNHVLSSLLPDKTDQHYYLTARRQFRQLEKRKSNGLIFSNNFTIRMLYKNVNDLCISFVLTTFNKDDDTDLDLGM